MWRRYAGAGAAGIAALWGCYAYTQRSIDARWKQYRMDLVNQAGQSFILQQFLREWDTKIERSRTDESVVMTLFRLYVEYPLNYVILALPMELEQLGRRHPDVLIVVVRVLWTALRTALQSDSAKRAGAELFEEYDAEVQRLISAKETSLLVLKIFEVVSKTAQLDEQAELETVATSVWWELWEVLLDEVEVVVKDVRTKDKNARAYMLVDRFGPRLRQCIGDRNDEEVDDLLSELLDEFDKDSSSAALITGICEEKLEHLDELGGQASR